MCCLAATALHSCGCSVKLFRLEVQDELKISQYYFIVSEDGQPMYLHMLGSELVTGAHFDEYEANFTYFQPSLSKADAFDIPELCKGKHAEIVPAGAMRSMSIHFAAFIPDVRLVAILLAVRMAMAMNGGPQSFTLCGTLFQAALYCFVLPFRIYVALTDDYQVCVMYCRVCLFTDGIAVLL